MVINPKIDEIQLTKLTGFDLETTDLFPWLGAVIDIIAIANEDGNQYVLEARHYHKEELTSLFKRVAATLVVGHNIKFDCNFVLYHYGVLFQNVFCTQIASQILENGKQKELKFSLLDVVARYLDEKHGFGQAEKQYLRGCFTDPDVQQSWHLLPELRNKACQYAAEDVAHLIPLYHKLTEALTDAQLSIILRLELLVLPVLSKMECRGILIDKNGWTKLIGEWQAEQETLITKLDEEAKRLIGKNRTQFSFERNRGTTVQYDIFGNTTTTFHVTGNNINYSSSDQLLQIWREFGESVPKDSDAKESVGEDVITTYLTEHPQTKLTTFIHLLLQYRELDKLISTYGFSFLAQLDDNNCIHTSYTQTRTETGRLSSKEPNLQNIPASKDPKRDVRRFFIARPGYKLITCDMSSAEVAIAADYSKEPLLLAALNEGTDMHSRLASVTFSIIFKQPIEIQNTKDEITIDGETYVLEDLRQDQKRVTFAKFYKAGATRVYQVLAKYINRHHPPQARKQVAQDISDALDKTMPILSKYLSSLIVQAKKHGFLLSDRLGRRRWFRSDVYGDAANYPIQGTNANALKIALLKLDKYFEETTQGHLLMNIHDETVSEVLDEFCGSSEKDPKTKKQLNLGPAAIKIRDTMADALSYFLQDVKGGASVSVDTKWKK